MPSPPELSPEESYPVPDHFNTPWMTPEKYREAVEEIKHNPAAFWTYKANKFIDWFQSWETLYEGDFAKGQVSWFKGGKLNACYNCIDRHLPDKAEKVAFFWEGDTPEQQKVITYQILHDEVCRLANGLKSRGIKKGDRVCIYLPMIPEAIYAMLACARIGAIHSVVFAGFSPQALRSRLLDANCRTLITADESVRGGKQVLLKQNADKALQDCPNVTTVLVVQCSQTPASPSNWQKGRDIDYQSLISSQARTCPPETMDSEDPLFILYTSGSTGKPKGIVHSTAGYLLHSAMTHHYLFDYHPDDIYWCAADVGWITGHSYIVYGPLANGATSVLFAGTPLWPDAARAWEMVDRYRVSIFYTAPTTLRALMARGPSALEQTSRDSLRLLGSVGEPLNPEAWRWYHQRVGKGRCPIIDTWWQTETGGAMIAPLPGVTPLKPGSVALPFPGIKPVLLDDQGNEIEGPGEGNLALKGSWPGQLRTILGNHQRLLDTYFTPFPGYYFTGDGACRDKDGYFRITGRVDDVMNISGHRIGTAEIESALVLHEAIAEAAVIAVDHPIKGAAIHAFVTPIRGYPPSETLNNELSRLVCQELGAFARPEAIQLAASLPKTRSGKIMRRILRKIANGETELGDTSTLADPGVVQQLLSTP